MKGMGNLFLIVILFNHREFIHNLKDPSFFRTNTIEVAYILLHLVRTHLNKSQINLSISVLWWCEYLLLRTHLNKSQINFSISILWWCEYLYGLILTRVDFGFSSIMCLIFLLEASPWVGLGIPFCAFELILESLTSRVN